MSYFKTNSHLFEIAYSGSNKLRQACSVCIVSLKSFKIFFFFWPHTWGLSSRTSVMWCEISSYFKINGCRHKTWPGGSWTKSENGVCCFCLCWSHRGRQWRVSLPILWGNTVLWQNVGCGMTNSSITSTIGTVLYPSPWIFLTLAKYNCNDKNIWSSKKKNTDISSFSHTIQKNDNIRGGILKI